MQLSAEVFRPLASYRVVAILLLAAGCSHGDALSTAFNGDKGPLDPGPPVRLTYSAREDQYAGWSLDGQGIVYTFVDAASRSGDRCLALLPPGGGQATVTRCGGTDGADDSTDTFIDAAEVQADRYAWVELHTLRGRILPDYGAIMLGALQQGSLPVKLTTLPYVAPSGNVHLSASNLRRLSPAQLAYIGVDLVPRSPCQGCKPDTLVVWHEVMLLNTTGGPPVPLANSDQTSSIWPDAAGTGIYYTVTGDSRVFHRTLAGGAGDMVHDFGAEGIARDVSVSGDRLVAVVGGRITYGFDPLIGAPLQFDSGGRLFTVNLSSGDEQELFLANTRFRRPAIAPGGQSVVAEGVDTTTTNRQPDLWLFRLQ
ncbi:MAG TPA: hypothetical protein VG817_07555 [Gemmatimonadales bacterium]|nr:hypothetical protein [Gemmatimonadales bacterium]